MGLKNIVKNLGEESIVIPAWDAYLVGRQEKSEHHSRPFVFHPSSIYVGQCMRRLFFDFIQMPDGEGVTDPNVLRIFDVGHDVHRRIQRDLRAAGILIEDEVKLEDAIHRLIGSADGLLKIGARQLILEIKSINANGFERLYKPDPKHVCQLTLYLHMKKLREGVVLYECKDNQRVKEFRVHYNERLAKELLDMLRHVLTEFHNAKVPAKGGDSPDSSVCRFCPFTQHCWEKSKVTLDWEALYAQYSKEKAKEGSTHAKRTEDAQGTKTRRVRLADIKRR